MSKMILNDQPSKQHNSSSVVTFIQNNKGEIKGEASG